ncbi:hypothetical protein ACOMHN_058252 [Nucella lapillus]
MAYCVIDGLRKTALGDSGGFLEALFQIAPNEVTQNISNPLQMTEELQTAVMNIIGLTPVERAAVPPFTCRYSPVLLFP